MVVAMRPGSTAPERGGDGQVAEVTGLPEGWHHGTSQREHMPWQGSGKGVAHASPFFEGNCSRHLYKALVIWKRKIGYHADKPSSPSSAM